MKTYGRKQPSALSSAPIVSSSSALHGFGVDRTNRAPDANLAGLPDRLSSLPAGSGKRQNKRSIVIEGEENESIAIDRQGSSSAPSSTSSSSSTQHSLRATNSFPSKRKCSTMDEILAAGHPEDIEILKSALMKKPSKGFKHDVRIWLEDIQQRASDPSRCEQWLDRIGFQGEASVTDVFFSLSDSKASDLRKLVNIGTRNEVPDVFSKPTQSTSTAPPPVTRHRGLERSSSLRIIAPPASSISSPTDPVVAATPAGGERLTPDTAAHGPMRAPTPSSNLAMDFGSMKLQSATPRETKSFFRDSAVPSVGAVGGNASSVAADIPPPSMFVSGQSHLGSHDENDAELVSILNEKEVSGAAKLASRLEHERHGETTFQCVRPSPTYPDVSSIATAAAVGADTLAPLPATGSSARPPREVTRGRRSKSFNDRQQQQQQGLPASCQSPQRSLSQPTNFVTPTKDPGYCFNDTEGALSDEIDRFRALLDYIPSSSRDENSLSQEPFPHLSDNSNSRSITEGFTVAVTAPSRADSFISSQSSMFSDFSMSSQESLGVGSVVMDRDMLINVERNIEIVRSRSQGGSSNSTTGFGTGGFGRVSSALNAQRRLVRMHSSPISSFHDGLRQGMHAIPEIDCSDDLGSPMDQQTPAMNAFSANKDRLLRSKNRRMSGKLDGSVKKLLFSKARRRQSNILFSRKTSPPAHVVAKHEEHLRGPDSLFPVLLGGVFMQRFEGIRAVVQRAAHTARVTSVSLGECGSVPQSFRSALLEWSHGHPLTATDVYIASGDAISLGLWSPSMGDTRAIISIDGYSWYAVPAFPSGILVMNTKFASVGDKRRVGFYIESNIINDLLGNPTESKSDAISSHMETFDYVGGNHEHLSLNISTSTDAFSEGLDALDISMYSEEHNRSDQNINLEDSGASDKFTMHKSHHHLKSLVSRHFGDSPSMSPLVNNDNSIVSADESKLFQSPIDRCGMGSSILGITASGSDYIRMALRDPQLALCTKLEPAVTIGSVLGLVMQYLGEDSTKPKTLRRSRSVRAESNCSFTIGDDSSSSDPRGFHAIRSVCKHWGVQAANYLVSKRTPKSGKAFKSLIAGPNLNNCYHSWSEYLKGITSCELIGTGGAKSVYSVARKNSQSLSGIEALATIDVDVVVDHAVKQELSVSTLASTLVQMRICPNILETYSTFESPYCIPRNFTGSSARSVIAKPKFSEVGHYQYISMELCRGGDIESSIRRQSKKVLPLDNVRSFLFQMIFSLYSSREQLNLRHNDVKLLNFLLSDASSLLPPKPAPSMSGDRRDSPRSNKISLKLGFGEHVFKLTLPLTPTCPSLVKLADFGTSKVGFIGAETSITPEHFTTLENTPPEFLILGSKSSSSSFAGDTFGLGLCYLHLLTGVAPYEELMNEVICPPDLRSLLKELWNTSDKSCQYYVIREVLDSLVEGDADTDDDDEPSLGQKESTMDDDSVMNVLYDTLYRYVVLVGLPPIDMFAGIDASTGFMSRNPVVLAIHAALAEKQQTFGVDAVRNSMHIYNQHAAKWSISEGSSEHMKRARDRLRDLHPSAGALLQSMLSFDPTKRCTMHEAILSNMFSVYREGGVFMSHDGGVEVVYDYYAKPKSCGGSYCLPNV